jgi:hypothetical protein
MRLTSARPWRPTKKLTYSAMAGLRELHSADPVQFNKQYLARKFGISFEAVSRILRSKWREKGKKSAEAQVAKQDTPAEKSIQGTKWDRTPETSQQSPAHVIANIRK